VPYILVALNKADAWTTRSSRARRTGGSRAAGGQEFDEDAPSWVSALKALEGDEKVVESVAELMNAVDESIPDRSVTSRSRPDACRGRLTITGRARWSPAVLSAVWST